ncbi:glucosamine-6-phosphate deaminase [Kineococcus sp. SYSU DK004]|uniref:glucosamine-6-phosphate deaminase n=1 Tax=Kineococcus sp. SYSU DK004 TaxID=3383125 RepID=UPI003D7C57EB
MSAGRVWSTRLVVEVLPDAAAIGRRGADLVAADLAAGRLRALGVATGSSPSPVYRELHRRALPGWAGVRLFSLDEYVGLPPGDPRSYAAVVEREVRAPLGVAPEDVHVPDGAAADLDAACRAFEDALTAAGGVDLQVLGIGATGHIGFNEPGSPLDSRTRVVELAERTRRDNARFFDDPSQVPRRALTQGVATIGGARRHLLVASGPGKAEAVRRALEGEVSPGCPASAVRTFTDVTVLLDPAAAALLQRPVRPVRAR